MVFSENVHPLGAQTACEPGFIQEQWLANYINPHTCTSADASEISTYQHNVPITSRAQTEPQVSGVSIGADLQPIVPLILWPL